jgi:signal recognition particle receptor subunit beta
MSFINYSSREINCKIVYYGPGLCGKTTNLQWIYNKTNPDLKGKMISLATETERTLFFDFLPLALGEIRGFKTRFHLYTVPGQVFYDASRKLILKGVDGVVFVADSQIERMEANVESVENLRLNLAEQGYSMDQTPCVIQYNKRDLPNAAPLDEMRAAAQHERLFPTSRRAPTDWQGRVRDAQGRGALGAARSQADEQLASRVAAGFPCPAPRDPAHSRVKHRPDRRFAPAARTWRLFTPPPPASRAPSRRGRCGRGRRLRGDPIVKIPAFPERPRAVGQDGWVIVSGILDESAAG